MEELDLRELDLSQFPDDEQEDTQEDFEYSNVRASQDDDDEEFESAIPDPKWIKNGLFVANPAPNRWNWLVGFYTDKVLTNSPQVHVFRRPKRIHETQFNG